MRLILLQTEPRAATKNFSKLSLFSNLGLVPFIIGTEDKYWDRYCDIRTLKASPHMRQRKTKKKLWQILWVEELISVK